MLHRSSLTTWFACALTAAVALSSARGADQPAAPGDNRADAGLNEGELGRPDAFGGYATTHVLVRLTPACVPKVLADGVWLDNGPIDALCRKWQVLSIVPAFSQPPQNAKLAEQYLLNRVYRFEVPKGTNTPALAAALAALKGVDAAEIDGIGGIALEPNDPYFGAQWSLNNPGGDTCSLDADIDAPEAWDLTVGAPVIVIAMIDSGIQATHPDLNAPGKVVSGWNTYDNNGNTDDPHGHGTHTAGIAAAVTNNGVGIAGVAWNATLLAIRCVASSGLGNESHCAAGVIWATDHGADIASMSLQYYTGSTVLRDAVAYAYDSGLLTVAAAGNGHQNFVSFPGKFPKCMAVAATDCSDAWYSSSNFGPEVDVAAPGRDIFSLWRDSGYQTFSGTSMATPHVSGLAALIWSYNRGLTNMQIESLLKVTAEDRGVTGFDDLFGWGRINARAALAAATPPGDMNCDGLVNNFDVDPFVLALIDPPVYVQQYPGCSILRADIDGNGLVNNFDVNAFIGLLLGL